MKPELDIDILKKLDEKDFDSSLNSAWFKFPPELVRNELARRLKLRTDLSIDAKRDKYKQIVDRYQRIAQQASFSDNFLDELSELFGDGGSDWEARTLARSEAVKSRIEQDLQSRERQPQRSDSFEGKTKPGDWRPDRSESCPVCSGIGTGLDQRVCRTCSGRGFMRS
jgi:DnaJ-class molecular chaperone